LWLFELFYLSRTSLRTGASWFSRAHVQSVHYL
jgi:hypothetical protein